jgi:hypothetical protein
VLKCFSAKQQGPRAMNPIAAGLGNVICSTALAVGVPGARCYDALAQQSFGYAGAALLLLLVIAALKGLRRWA